MESGGRVEDLAALKLYGLLGYHYAVLGTISVGKLATTAAEP